MSQPEGKPVLDQQALERLLEAAFVLQEHNRERGKLDPNAVVHYAAVGEQEKKVQGPAATDKSAEAPKDNYTVILGNIVETQRQIQSRNLNLEDAMALVAERIVAMTGATGAALGTVEGKHIRYRTSAGSHALPSGTEIPVNKALSSACLLVGQVIRCKDVNTEFLVDVEACRRRGIQSLVAVPIYHDGQVSGALELYFASADTFTEQDVHSCQLMAGLVTEALARDDELAWKKSLAAERATMLEALEKLKPNLVALMGTPAKDVGARSSNLAPDIAASASSLVCRKCGHELVADEQFCGKCGSPRIGSEEPPSMQTKVASLWQMQQAKQKEERVPANGTAEAASPSFGADSDREDAYPSETLDDELLSSLQADLDSATDDAIEGESPEDLVRRLTDPETSRDAHAESEAPSTALVKSDNGLTWTSAAKARDFLEQAATGQKPSSPLVRFWNARRGDIYLAFAVILVAIVIRWGIWSNHSVGATGPTAVHHKAAPDADLSRFDKLLISLGLAEAPEAPESRGNPETRVWVDTHTALYYCPGTDLYGKTPKGKFTSQRDAQLDQFEPAYRKACD